MVILNIYFLHRKFCKKISRTSLSRTHFFLLAFWSLSSDFVFINLSSSKFTVVCFQAIFSMKMNTILEKSSCLGLFFFFFLLFVNTDFNFFQLWENSWGNIETDLVHFMLCEADIPLLILMRKWHAFQPLKKLRNKSRNKQLIDEPTYPYINLSLEWLCELSIFSSHLIINCCSKLMWIWKLWNWTSYSVTINAAVATLFKMISELW